MPQYVIVLFAGIPAIIVGITLAVDYTGYGTDSQYVAQLWWSAGNSF